MSELNYLQIEGQLLKVLLAVIEHNSVSTAALELDLNQSSVSYSLDKLRTIFKDPLFVKSGRGIEPTERALELTPLVRDLLQRMETIANLPTYFPQTDTKPFTLASDISQKSPICTHLYRALSIAAPNAPFKLLSLGSYDNIRPFLETEKVNLVISPLVRELHGDLMFHPVFTEEMVCFYDPDIRTPPNSEKDFMTARHAVLDFVGFGKGIVARELQKMKINRNVFLSAPNFSELATMVKGTDFIITARQGLNKTEFSNLAYCPAPIPLPAITYNLIWHRRRNNSPGNVWFRKMVLSSYEEARSDTE